MLARLRKAALAVLSALRFTAPRSATEPEAASAMRAAEQVSVEGPCRIPIGEEGFLDLDADEVYIPQPAAARLLRAVGNSDGTEFLGIIIPWGDLTWFAGIRFTKDGHIPDDEAQTWDSDDLLTRLQALVDERTRAARADGFPGLDAKRWIEEPTYDRRTRRLVWSALALTRGESDPGSVNYSVHVLGRDGALRLYVVGKPELNAQLRARAYKIAEAFEFAPGRRYEDFDPRSDPVAPYGLAGLITGR